MELAHSLLLNEEALSKIPDNKKPVFVFEWLRFLDKVLVAAQKSDIKEKQKQLVSQLTSQISESPGPPTRKLLARNLATIFSVGDTFDLFDTLNKCNDIIKNRDDSPSYLPTKLAAIGCLGAMYEKLGRMTGRSFEETVQTLIKSLKNAESQGRSEIMSTLEKVIKGLGTAGNSTYKDVYKATKQCMTDRSMVVRFAAAKCMLQLVYEAPFMYTSELETVCSLCFRALDGSNYDVRCAVAKLLGNLMSTTQSPKAVSTAKWKQPKLEDVLNLLSVGFLKGGIGSGNINREIRVGVTHAYIEFVKSMGGLWLERNISVFLNHILELVANPKATPTHVDAVYARKCVLFIIRSAIGGLLGEKAQIAAAKEISQIIVKQMNIVGEATVDSDSRSSSLDIAGSQHVLVCSLHELGSLVLRLGTSASPLVAEPATGIIEPVVSVLIHPSHAARLAASWCLGSISRALPSQLTPLLDRCVERMDKLKTSPEAVSGYSSALAALLGGVYQCPLGIPHAKGKQLFNLSEELLRTASQNSRLSLQRTQSGWLLLGSLMTLGPAVVKNHLPRMLLLWKNAFPRSHKELEAEKQRGDSFTWQVTLEARSGALGAMNSFLQHSRDLVTEDVIRRLLAPLKCALLMFVQLPWVIKQYGTHLKASAAMVRLRLYDVLSQLPPESFEGTYTDLLRELVAEFTLTDNPANTTTSLLRAMCHVDDSVILGSWLQETDHKAIEDQLQPNSASGSGALEHDSQSLYARCSMSDPVPGPLPLGVAVIDSSVRLYGLVFPRVAHKHRLQMLQHFIECIKQAKSVRQQAVQMNIFTAVLCALKNLADAKESLGPDEVKKSAFNLIMGALSSTNPILRCAAGEALGRIAQVVGDSRFIADMAQYSFNSLKSARDVINRTGHSLALGCLHRYVGGMGSGQHLNTSVSILLALAKDSNSPVVQVWSLHALGLIADSGGPMFRSYVEPTLSLVLQLLLSVPPSTVDVHQCLGKCLSALITSLGPELQGNSGAIATARLYSMVCCAIMQDHPDSLVQAEAITCLQQLHMFAPRHVNLTSLVPHLCATLNSSHLLLRRAAVGCLRQLVTREAGEVSDQALTLAGDDSNEDSIVTETGLEGLLFGMMDTEIDGKLISDVQDTLISLLQSLATQNLTRWLLLLKGVLSSSTDAGSSGPLESGTLDNKEKDDDDDEEEDAELEFKASAPDVTHPTVAPRWPTRVFATECLQKILLACEGVQAHFDLELAKEIRLKTSNENYLALHLSELVRMAFIAATSDSNQLRLAGLSALQDIITKFATVPEPEFPGHVILEQFQAQVSAALRPAFSPDTSSDVTAAACDVCSTWIGSGVARDLNDLRRVHQLLVSSLAKLNAGKSQSPLYNESAVTMEKLAVLGAWAEVYIVAVEREHEKETKPQKEEEEYGESSRESLLSLVQPELPTLSQNWLGALRDYAYLSLPTEYSSQLPSDGGTFYHPDTIDSAKPHYKKRWTPILHALAIWLHETGFSVGEMNKESDKNSNVPANAPANMKRNEINSDRLYLILGICVEALSNPQTVLSTHAVNGILKAIAAVLSSDWPKQQIGADPILSKEVLNVMHRVFLTQDNVYTQLLAVKVLKAVLLAGKDSLQQDRAKVKEKELETSTSSSSESMDTSESGSMGDGGEEGDIIPEKSVVYAALEVCLCVISRQIPALNPSAPNTGFQIPTRLTKMSDENCSLVASIVLTLADLPNLCSKNGSTSVLPTILFLITGVLREMSNKGAEKKSPLLVQGCLTALRTLCCSSFLEDEDVGYNWKELLRSALVTVLQNSKPVDDKPGMDEVTLLATVTMFLVWGPEEIAQTQAIQIQCVTVFRDCWESNIQEVQLKCLQMFMSVIQKLDAKQAIPYIRGVAAKFLEYLLVLKDDKSGLDSQQALITASLNFAEVLVAKAEDDKRLQLLSLFLPVLVSFLVDEKNYTTVSKPTQAIHDDCLQRLVKIGPMYPEQFKNIMTSHTDLKLRLGLAIKHSQTQSSSQRKMEAAALQQKLNQKPAKPTIALKTNFGNFAAS
ncbi:HEAT repeat-containing protein 5B-like isoform X6 [Ostrea edulis]|uniref:HEAT repeat-containing protein 5B-like isoform X6 n=1 Tax=Ostrea edulis TaxID=37623 RepID=UPI0024AF9E15|nr:HEAT repeat-containing protein 5B-like isoform X6 [Ostrea edulis]XP_056020629.1 HEAT repeat-containing protein 5B-like isoform X6 [Ostrea edulis]XP_056020630.1 HEAT repeat-containing protein 5B-like isoform X6 [Ostrea edulis]